MKEKYNTNEKTSFSNRIRTQTQTQNLKIPDPNFADLGKNRTRNLVETKIQIEYTSRESNSAKNKIFREKLDLLSYQSIFKLTNLFGTPVENT